MFLSRKVSIVVMLICTAASILQYRSLADKFSSGLLSRSQSEFIDKKHTSVETGSDTSNESSISSDRVILNSTSIATWLRGAKSFGRNTTYSPAGSQSSPPGLQGSSEHGKESQEVSQSVEVDNECRESKPAHWNWSYHDGMGNTFRSNKKLLIAMYSGYGSYERLLNLTAAVNHVYANMWGHDTVTLLGAGLLTSEDGDCEPPAYRATFNKIPILQAAIDAKDERGQHKYDQVLILDSDAMMYDLEFDISTLLMRGKHDDPRSDWLLAARRCSVNMTDHYWDLNAGVTLWNLHHPLIHQVSEEWNEASLDGIIRNQHPRNDQYHLHRTLQNPRYSQSIRGLIDEFNYKSGTVVRHYIRGKKSKKNGWSEASMAVDRREDRILRDVENINARYASVLE